MLRRHRRDRARFKFIFHAESAPGRPMMSTFLPAHAFLTSRKTGGLNSRPSCVRGAVVCCLSQRFVSRSGRATRVAETVSRLRALRRATVAVGSCRSPRATAPRARPRLPSVVGHCDLHGPAHPGSHPRPSPWLRPSANASRPAAPFLRCTRPVGGPTTTTNCNVSHLKERLCPAGLSASRRDEPYQRPLREPQQRARTLWASGKTLASAYTTSQ